MINRTGATWPADGTGPGAGTDEQRSARMTTDRAAAQQQERPKQPERPERRERSERREGPARPARTDRPDPVTSVDLRVGGVEVRPVAGHIGAEITGVDLAAPLDDAVADLIRRAVLRWKVVFFRDQRLDHAGQVAFARHFGEPVVLGRRGGASPPDFPEVETTADRLELGGRYGMDHEEWLARRRPHLLRGWHCDHGARVDPPAATVLRAESVPPYGGDTTWANLAAAYAGLSAPVRAFVDGLRAEHRLGVGYQPRPGDDAYLRHLLDHQMACEHPLVRVHPETGERVLFVNGYYIEQITGVSRPESAALLQMLLDQAVRPEYTVRFRWAPGSVAFWDNRATIHLAPSDHTGLDVPRIMHRVMLHGEVPVGVDGRPSTPVTGTEAGRW
ncbi:dioxygenase [Streptomyces griseofuscus]|uniref:Dioxygenase n=2 Tax=Streptomyces griseofuscus TaxID=146922 RepID=A0A7H1QAK6_9ACTN|nr:dioxygenase [Streptomyces griseofuscus]